MDKFLNLADLAHFWGRIKAKLDGKQNALVSGTNIKTINNENLLGSGNIDIHGDDVFVAVYEQTSYADVTAAIDASKVIMLDMPANHNLFNITHATYTNGGNAVMYSFFKMNNRATLMTVTLTPTGNWTVAHTDLQEKLVSGTNIKTINNQSLLGSGNIDVGGGGDDEIGYIVYNTTTFDEAAEILNNHKICAFKYTNQVGTVPIVHKFVSSNEIAFQFFSGNHSTTQLYIAPTYFTCRIYKEGTVTKWAFNSNALQPILSSGNTIKTINNESLLGSGNIDIPGGTVDTAMSDTSENAVQNKVIKSYVDAADTNLQSQLDTLTGKVGMNLEVGKERWYGTYTDENGETFQVYSKVVYIPALPSTPGITTYSHGVSNIKQILSIYGFTTDGFVLNAPRQVASDNITIYQASKSSSNQTFSIEVGKDRSSKKAYVTMIYAKNN